MTLNPYKAPSGVDLDTIIHQRVMGYPPQPSIPSYSSDEQAARQVERQLRKVVKDKITVGESRVAALPFFARYGTDPSTSTEVLAETYPLAVCRLALLYCC